MTEPRLRINEILDHALAINKQHQQKKRVRKKILDLLEKELHEAKKINLKYIIPASWQLTQQTK